MRADFPRSDQTRFAQATRGGGSSGGAEWEVKVRSAGGTRSPACGEMVHPVGASGGILVGTIDSGTESCGPRHFDLRVGWAQITRARSASAAAFLARQQEGRSSEGGAT